MTIPASVTSAAGAFNNCDNLTSATFADGIKRIPGSIFYGSALQSVVIPEGVTVIENSAFACSENLGSVTLPSTLKTIEDYAFGNCDELSDVVLPASLTTAGGAFAECDNLLTAEIASGATKIVSGAFRYSGISRVKIPASVKLVKEDAFCDCENLATVVFDGTAAQWSTLLKVREGGNDALANAHVIYPSEEHDYSAEVTDPTCTRRGFTTYTCSICGDVYRADYVPALGHDWSEWEITEPATCSWSGEKRRVCSHNEEHVETDEIKYDPNAHHYIVDYVQEPGCDYEGYTEYRCEYCWNSYVSDYVDALGHDWECIYKEEPGCTWSGYAEYRCKRCDNWYEESYGEPTGHKWECTYREEPGCTWQGYAYYECETCHDTYGEYYGEPTGHDWQVSYVEEPTCTEQGYTEYRCSKCEDTYGEYVDALGHEWVGQVISPTCTTEGYTHYHCDGCDEEYYSDYVEPTGHNYVNGVCVNPGCGADDPNDDIVPGKITVSSASAKAGETVTLTLTLSDNPGIAAMWLKPIYDADVLTEVDAVSGGLFSAFTRGINYVFDDEINVTANGVLLTVTFKIADDAKAGDYPVEILVREASDYDMNDVALVSVPGTVTVLEELERLGDLNGDGKLNSRDVIAMMKLVLQTNPVVTSKNDINGDGKLNSRDVIGLMKLILAQQ